MSTVHRSVDTDLGTYLVAVGDDPHGRRAVTGIWREAQTHFPADDRLGERVDACADPLLDTAVDQLLDYITSRRDGFDLPLAPQGTAFQESVWQRLTQIPRGETVTYGEIARELGRPRASQAVGAAVGSNPVSIAVPCHRVVSSTGALTGYAGGIDVKRRLLALEGAEVSD